MRSLLVHREHPPLVPAGRDDELPRCVVVALHGEGGDVDELAGVAREAAPRAPVRAAQAARPRNPAHSGSNALPGYEGYAWYRVQDDGNPDPATFDDSLRQVEAFVLDTLERYPGPADAPERRIVIVARGQGAAIGRAVARRRGNVVAGVYELTAALLLGLIALLAAPMAQATSSGPQPGTTGAPAIAGVAAEMDCTSCHTGQRLNPDDAGKVELSGLPSAYEPGKRYTVTFRISHPDPALARWGFQVTAVRLSDGHGAGELLVTDAPRTQKQTGVAGREYVEHTVPGTAIGQPGGATWTFDWVAPAAGAGDVEFFGVGNAANVDGSNQGDHIYGPSPAPLATLRPSPGPAAH